MPSPSRTGPVRAATRSLARFDRIDGLKRGADVTVSGVKVGSVTGVRPRPQDLPGGRAHDAVVVESACRSTPTPRSSSESLLGGMVVVLEPGGDNKMIQAGGEIDKTQGAVPSRS